MHFTAFYKKRRKIEKGKNSIFNKKTNPFSLFLWPFFKRSSTIKLGLTKLCPVLGFLTFFRNNNYYYYNKINNSDPKVALYLTVFLYLKSVLLDIVLSDGGYLRCHRTTCPIITRIFLHPPSSILQLYLRFRPFLTIPRSGNSNVELRCRVTWRRKHVTTSPKVNNVKVNWFSLLWKFY